MKMNVLGIIPSRMKSTRFYGKPLALINNKPMIQHVYEKVVSCKKIKKVIVATDSTEIMNTVHKFNGEAMLTSSKHLSGLDRIIEVISDYSEFNYIINVQGDEPLINVKTIDKVLNLLVTTDEFPITTAAVHFKNKDDFLDINQVKVVVNKNKAALYFSRAPIPYNYDNKSYNLCLKHQGIYGYTQNILKKIKSLKSVVLEKLESLEQLRFLYYGIPIGVALTDYDSIGVDVPNDIKKIELEINKQYG